MKTLYRLGFLSLVACAQTGLAFAAPQSDAAVEVHSLTVKYNRAEIQTEPGAKALHRKLQSAARDVCNDGTFARSYAMWARQECAATAVTNAVIAVNVAALDTVHGYRRGSVEVIARR